MEPRGKRHPWMSPGKCRDLRLQSRSQLTQLYDKLRIINTGSWGSIPGPCCNGFPNICLAPIAYERDINAGDGDPSARGRIDRRIDI